MKNSMMFLMSVVLISSFFSCESAVKTKRELSTNPLKDEWISNEVGYGLHKITIDDSTQILIYRGTESCTMIQIK
jgi:hypothetical protein